MAMLLGLDRRLIAGMTAVLFALSVVGHAVMAAEIAGKAASVATEVAVHNPAADCDDCPGGNGAARVGCSIHCASVVGIIAHPIDVAALPAAERSPSLVVRPLPDRSRPPDPRPPKSSLRI